jgi:hypothetical protein
MGREAEISGTRELHLEAATRHQGQSVATASASPLPEAKILDLADLFHDNWRSELH